MKKNEFFREVSIASQGVDPDIVKRVFYAIVRTASRGLRAKKVVRFPDFGDFSLVTDKPRRSFNVKTGLMEYISSKTRIKFTPNYKMKEYFKKFGENNNFL